MGDFKPPRARPLEHREALSAEQCRRLLDAARGHYLEVPVALALFAGLSRADLRAIIWKEVDLEAGLIARPRDQAGVHRGSGHHLRRTAAIFGGPRGRTRPPGESSGTGR